MNVSRKNLTAVTPGSGQNCPRGPHRLVLSAWDWFEGDESLINLCDQNVISSKSSQTLRPSHPLPNIRLMLGFGQRQLRRRPKSLCLLLCVDVAGEWVHHHCYHSSQIKVRSQIWPVPVSTITPTPLPVPAGMRMPLLNIQTTPPPIAAAREAKARDPAVMVGVTE